MKTLMLFCLLTSSCLAMAETSKKSLNDIDKTSYSLGTVIGQQLHQQLPKLNIKLFSQGLEDAKTKNFKVLNQAEIESVMVKFQQSQVNRLKEIEKSTAHDNLSQGQAFLATNKKHPHVKTLASGLQYQILHEGKGQIPSLKDKVVVHYQGTLVDGREFDSSIKRGSPATFPVTGVIKAWTEALQLMPVGSKWKLFVPASLGYGSNQAGSMIGPNSTLIFEVELLSIVPDINRNENYLKESILGED